MVGAEEAAFGGGELTEALPRAALLALVLVLVPVLVLLLLIVASLCSYPSVHVLVLPLVLSLSGALADT